MMRTLQILLFISYTLFCAAVHPSSKEEEVNDSINSPEWNEYNSGPLPYLRLKKAGFDVSHTLREMESPAPSPSPNCEPLREAYKKACAKRDAASETKKEKCILVEEAEMLKKLLEARVEHICSEIESLKGDHFDDQNIAQIEDKLTQLKRDKAYYENAERDVTLRLPGLIEEKIKATTALVQANNKKIEAGEALLKCLQKQ